MWPAKCPFGGFEASCSVLGFSSEAHLPTVIYFLSVLIMVQHLCHAYDLLSDELR